MLNLRLPIQCMTELTTEEYDPAYSIDCIMHSVDTSRHPITGELIYPDWPKTFLVFPIHRYTQKVRKDRDKGYLDNSSRRFIWKPFENYKISSGNGQGIEMSYWDKSRGYPPAHVYYSDPRVPAILGYWHYTPLQGDTALSSFGEAGKFNLETTINGSLNCPRFLVPQDNGSFVAPPANLDQLQQRALSHMLPKIKEELSAINSVYELKDFKSLPGLAKKVARSGYLARTMLSYIHNWNSGKVSRSTLRDIARLASENFLQWKFAIAPLLSDISGIRAALSTYKRNINSLVSKTGGRQTRHFTFRWREFEDSSEVSEAGFPQPWIGLNGCVLYNTERKVYHESSVFHAQVQYNYNYTAYQQQNAEILALLDSLGVNFSPRILWDALPWSFVLDWVLKVGDSLEQFRIRNMEPQINIHQYLWSIKRERRIICSTGPSPDVTELESLLDRSRVSLPLVREEVYGRFTDYPVVPSLIETSGLSLSEFSLASAIVVAQRRKRIKRTRSK